MKNVKLLSAVLVATVLGIGIGFLSHKGIDNLLHEKQVTKYINTLDSMRGSVMFSELPGANSNDKLDTAHKYSKNYRTNANLCTDITNAGKVLVDTSAIGFTEMDFPHVIDLLAAMSDIKESAPSTIFKKFRIINGQDDNGKGTLIIVPLISDPTDQTKLIELPSIRIGQLEKSLIRIIDYKIDCPIKCDCKGSEVIVGQNGACR